MYAAKARHRRWHHRRGRGGRVAAIAVAKGWYENAAGNLGEPLTLDTVVSTPSSPWGVCFPVAEKFETCYDEVGAWPVMKTCPFSHRAKRWAEDCRGQDGCGPIGGREQSTLKEVLSSPRNRSSGRGEGGGGGLETDYTFILACARTL